MKKVFNFFIGALILWLFGSYWATSWIDKKSFDDFPGKNELAIARILWVLSPVVNRTDDANRVLKFSWLSVSSVIYSKEKKDNQKIIDVLSKEFKFISEYILLNNKSISSEVKDSTFIQLVTYLNRINLFQKYFDPLLEVKLIEFDQRIGSLSPVRQEDWYREMMIHGQLKGDSSIYQKYRNKYVQILHREGVGIPKVFIEGVIDFYDGILLCANNQSREALPYLKSAEVKLAKYPDYTMRFFSIDLNVLLIGRGKMSGADCDNSISKVISAGEM